MFKIIMLPRHFLPILLTTLFVWTKPSLCGDNEKKLSDLAQSLQKLDAQVRENFIQGAKKQIQELIERSDQVRSKIVAVGTNFPLGIGSEEFRKFLTDFGKLLTQENLQTKSNPFLNTKISSEAEKDSFFSRAKELVGIGENWGLIDQWRSTENNATEGITPKQRDEFTGIFKIFLEKYTVFSPLFITAALTATTNLFNAFDKSEKIVGTTRKKISGDLLKEITEKGQKIIAEGTKKPILIIRDQAELTFYSRFLAIIEKQTGQKIGAITELIGKKPADSAVLKTVQFEVQRLATRTKQIFDWEKPYLKAGTVGDLGDRIKELQKKIIEETTDKKLADTTNWNNKDPKLFHQGIEALKKTLKNDDLKAAIEEYIVLTNFTTIKKAPITALNNLLFPHPLLYKPYLGALEANITKGYKPSKETFSLVEVSKLAKDLVLYENFVNNLIAVKVEHCITLDEYIALFTNEYNKLTPVFKVVTEQKTPPKSFGAALQKLVKGFSLDYSTTKDASLNLLEDQGGVFFLTTFTALLQELLDQGLFLKENPV